MSFEPDYRHIVNAAYNKETARVPIYEHNISISIMEKILDRKFADLRKGDKADRREYFRTYCEFFKHLEYDVVSYEGCVGNVMPGSGSLGGHKPGEIQNREDFEKYQWDVIHDRFFDRFDEDFQLLTEVIPDGMKVIGGVGNGLFECVQDVVGYESLCMISFDDPELYADLFKSVARVNLSIWKTFLDRYSDLMCVCRFGDDMGFKTAPLLPPDDIRTHIVPGYKTIIELIHSYNKPFLLHSCGSIFDVMEDLITVSGIDAKHSNEDAIAPFSDWVEKYGDRIGNFGGVDTDLVCQPDVGKVKEYMDELLSQVDGKPGIAIGSGNSIPDYTDVDAYLTMNESVCSWRSR